MALSDKRQVSKTIKKTLASYANARTEAAALPEHLQGRKADQRAFEVQRDRIRRDENQVRTFAKDADDPVVQELAASIKDFGLQHNVGVRWIDEDNIWEVVEGDARFVAVTEILNWDYVPVHQIDVRDDDVLWLQLHENEHRRSLHPLDLATALKTAFDRGLNLAEIAKKMKKSQTYVQKALTVADNLDQNARKMLLASPKGNSLETAYAVATAPIDQQSAIANQIVEDGLSQRQVRQLTKQAKQDAGRRSPGRGRRPNRRTSFKKTFHASNGLVINVTARKSRVSDEEIVRALKDVARSISAPAARKTA